MTARDCPGLHLRGPQAADRPSLRARPSRCAGRARLAAVTERADEQSFEQLGFDEVVEALRVGAAAGQKVLVFVAPRRPPDGGPGMVWASMVGDLRGSEAGGRWGPNRPEDPSREGIAFQLGASDENYFVLYREFFSSAEWISRDAGLLSVEGDGFWFTILLGDDSPAS